MLNTDYEKTIVCDQHGVMFTHSRDRYPIIATFALNACIGLVMHCPKYQVISVAHIDGLPGYSMRSAIDDGVNISFDPVSTNIDMILSIIRKLSNTSECLNINYYMIGGIFNLSEIMIHDIIEHVGKIDSNKYKIKFSGRNLLGPENQSRNICINSINGHFNYFDYSENSDQNLYVKNIIKAPRKSEAMLDISYIGSI